MQPYIQVTFDRMDHDPSVEAAARRGAPRLESTAAIKGAFIAIEHEGRRRTGVRLRLALADGSASTTAAAHEDIYVAVADAFRAARRQLLARAAAAAGGWFARYAA
jgi:hypothetical protein